MAERKDSYYVKNSKFRFLNKFFSGVQLLHKTDEASG